jgi:hypothetical protein
MRGLSPLRVPVGMVGRERVHKAVCLAERRSSVVGAVARVEEENVHAFLVLLLELRLRRLLGDLPAGVDADRRLSDIDLRQTEAVLAGTEETVAATLAERDVLESRLSRFALHECGDARSATERRVPLREEEVYVVTVALPVNCAAAGADALRRGVIQFIRVCLVHLCRLTQGCSSWHVARLISLTSTRRCGYEPMP